MIGGIQSVGTRFEGLKTGSFNGPEERSRATAVWLALVAALVVAMVVVGGATRLTGSGLSITEWKPVSGALPPMTGQAWQKEFSLYRAIPQYAVVNPTMSLEQFKSIFWWEWSHRLLGRLVGLAFVAPFAALLILGRIPRRLIGRCLGLFLLGGLQGLVGWWMVQSGLEARVSVAPERLAAHLCLALLLFCALIWTSLEAWFGPSSLLNRPKGWPRVGQVFLAAVFCQCVMGALVAGNHAGLIDNDWPWMAGAFIPTDYWLADPWSTVLHGASAVQFNHRMLAYSIAGLSLGIGGRAGVSQAMPVGLRILAISLPIVAMTQVGLGVFVLLSLVSLPIALMHQLVATLLLAIAVVFAWRSRRLAVVS